MYRGKPDSVNNEGKVVLKLKRKQFRQQYKQGALNEEINPSFGFEDSGAEILKKHSVDKYCSCNRACQFSEF